MASEVIRVPATGERADVIGRVTRLLSRLPVGKAFDVEVREYKRKRTDSQNRMLWAMYQQIIDRGGEEMAGWDRDDIHEFFLGTHFGWQRLEGLGRTRLKPLRRSSALNKQEFSDYVDHIIRFMSERGVVLNLPQEDAA